MTRRYIAFLATILWGYTGAAAAMNIAATAAARSPVGPVSSLPPRNPPPPPPCASRASGHLSATPDSIDRATNLYRAVTFDWSVSVPSGCNVTVGISPLVWNLELSGSLTQPVSHSATFSLVVSSGGYSFYVANTTVTVTNDPGVISVSDDMQLSQAEASQFYQQWMQPFDVMSFNGNAGIWLNARDGSAVWGITERMVSFARMYQATHNRDYLDRLQELVELVLRYRDDNYVYNCSDCTAPPHDDFRNATEPAWGGKSFGTANYDRVDEVVSGLYGYSIALFTRIVAENVSLQSTYGAAARDYANKVLQTMWVFEPQLRYTPHGGFYEGYLAYLPIVNTLLTPANCQHALAVAIQNAGSPDSATLARMNQLESNCEHAGMQGNYPFAHNEQMAYMMMLMELWRALDSDWYRSGTQATSAEPARDLIPLVVARYQRFFVDRQQPKTYPDLNGQLQPGVYWNYADGLPSGINMHSENTPHGSIDMQYLKTLRLAWSRLNAKSNAFGEPIPFDDGQFKAFANTFAYNMQNGDHLADDVEGRAANPVDADDAACEGWIALTPVNQRVWTRCRDISLNFLFNGQPNLRIGNHSALLAEKQPLPRWAGGGLILNPSPPAFQ